MWRKGNPLALLVEMQTGAATVGCSMEIPQKIKNGSAFFPKNPISGNYPKEPKTLIQKNISNSMFIAVLFTIIKIWKQPKFLPVDDWIKQIWYIYTMEYHSAITKKILPFAMVRVDLEKIMLSEISQSEKDKYSIP